MSNPFRGHDVAADMITSEDLEECAAYVREKMAKVSAEMAAIAATGDARLYQERFGYLSRLRADPEGPCLVLPVVESEYSLCKVCEKVFAKDIEISESWSPALYERYAHHTNFTDLQQAAKSRCPLCWLLWKHISNAFSAQSNGWYSRRRNTFDYVSFSIARAKNTSSPAYLLNFVYGGNTESTNYDAVHSLQLCLVSASGKLLLHCWNLDCILTSKIEIM